MNPMMRNVNEMVLKTVKAREMSVKYTVNFLRIFFNSADTSLIEEIGGNTGIQVFLRKSGEIVGE